MLQKSRKRGKIRNKQRKKKGKRNGCDSILVEHYVSSEKRLEPRGLTPKLQGESFRRLKR